MAGEHFKVLLMNGPNLNLLGNREPEHYGRQTLDDIVIALRSEAHSLAIDLQDFQSNAEHEMVERVHAAGRDGCDAIIINPGAFTHTSVALRDALVGINVPFIEVHLSNIHGREAFRSINYFSDVAAGSIIGLGAPGYSLALQATAQRLSAKTKA